MKLVIQRVSKATVTAEDGYTASIQKGLLMLLGITHEDTEKEANELVEKVYKLRVLADEEGKMNLAVKDVRDASFLVISQFTLYADTKGGNRPSFVKAARPEQAKPLYEYFVKQLSDKGVRVKTGSFGNYMHIDAQLDGPVTIVMESNSDK